MKTTFILLFLLVFQVNASDTKQIIDFSEEELPRESVVPVFEEKVAVRSKAVPKKSRFELGLQLGNILTEAFYDPVTFGGSASYNFSEFHAIELSAMMYSFSESQFVDIINEDVPGNNFDFKNVPTPKSLLLASWEFTPYYGKVSLSKQTVYNIAIYTNFHLGMVDNGASSTLAYGFGLGQKVYFGPNWGIKIDLKGLFHDVANPLTSDGTFKEENKFHLMLNVGLLTMLPSISR